MIEQALGTVEQYAKLDIQHGWSPNVEFTFDDIAVAKAVIAGVTTRPGSLSRKKAVRHVENAVIKRCVGFEVESKQQYPRGEMSGNAKLTAKQVLEIYSDPRRQVDIAKDYGVLQGTVSRIKLGRGWAHVTGAKHRPKKRRLTPKKVLAIYRSPRPYKELAQAHSVNSVTIGDIKNGKTWAHVTGHKTGAAE